MHLLNFYQIKNNRKFIKSDKSADLSIGFFIELAFFFRSPLDTDVPLSTREWFDIRVIYMSGQLSKQIIQLIDYSDVSSGPDSIQAPDESDMTTRNNWLAK